VALGTIPPWLDITPETFLGAAKAGAQIGTQRRKQDLDTQDAADRLRLAYDSLASQERRASESEQMKLELAKNAQQLRQSQMDAVNLRAQERLQQQQQMGNQQAQFHAQTLALRQSRGEMLDKHRSEMIDQQEQNRALREQLGTQDMAIKQAGLGLRQQKSEDALTPLQTHDLTVKSHGLAEAQKAMSAAIAGGDGDSIASARKLLDAAKKDYTDFRSGLGKSKETSVPPVNEREVGHVYITPKGPHEWTGKGWRLPKETPAAPAAAPDESMDNTDDQGP
jgi:hypothetical protein